MGIRQLLKRAAKPLVMGLVAGGLAVSLVVTTPSNAQALVVAPVLPVVLGATQMAIPSLMATSSIFGPVGWTIAGLAVVGIGLYASRDYWLPYVTGEFGQPKIEHEQSPTEYEILPGLGWGADPVGGMPYTINGTPTNTRNMTFYFDYQGTGNNPITTHFTTSWHCKQTVAQTGKPIGTEFDFSFNWTFSVSATNRTPFLTGNVCPTNSIIFDRGQAGPAPKGSGSLNGPDSFVYWGSAVPGGFDPRGPDVRYESTVECVRPDGSLFSLTAISYGGDGRLKMSSCEAASPGSHGTGKASVKGFAPGSTQGTEIWSATAPVPEPDRPLCGPTIPGTGCKLGVYIDTKPCVVGTWDCEHWPDLRNDPNQAPRVSCQYGPYVMPIETCNPLERAYEPDGAPASDANLDGNPATRSDTMPNGQPQPRESTLTPTVPGTVPGVGGAPSGVPGSTAQEAACWPSGWGMLNPLEWVYKPVVCASRALFEPTKSVQTRVTSMQGAFANKVPVSWFGTGVSGVSGGACPTSWQVTFQGQSYSLICGTPADGIIQGFRPVLGAMLIIAAVWPLIRSLFYAAIPVFKVTPS